MNLFRRKQYCSGLLTGALISFSLCFPAHASKVVIDNIGPPKGNIVIALYAKQQDFFTSTNAIFSKTLPAQDSRVEIELENVPAGNYAVAGFHDVNGNGELDIGGPFNTPIEPLIWGNNASGTYGVPTFSAARVFVEDSTHVYLTF